MGVKFKDITTNTNIIAHLIATAIDYPLDYVKEIIDDKCS